MAENGSQPATKKDVFEIVAEASELIINGMEEVFRRQGEKYDSRFTKLESGQRDIKRQLKDLQTDTPVMAEFNKLKAKVDRHHPTN